MENDEDDVWRELDYWTDLPEYVEFPKHCEVPPIRINGFTDYELQEAAEEIAKGDVSACAVALLRRSYGSHNVEECRKYAEYWYQIVVQRKMGVQV